MIRGRVRRHSEIVPYSDRSFAEHAKIFDIDHI